ncbi:octanoyltransferase [Bacteroidia bacterium]|nr:octanoyltransferase [Bacteroidia bacterium]GHV70769.1 octanoyltransferase [Bacteroidia bacterium]
MRPLTFVDWGLISYSEAYEKQKKLFEASVERKAARQETQNTIVFCEHPHVITIGKNGLFSNLLFSEKTLQEKEVELFHVDRGGDITYHGQGQLVAYPILDLDTFHIGLKEYIYRLEEIIILLLAEYGIQGHRLSGATGVWLDTDKPGKVRKICAIGVKSRRYITMHGFALNVSTDLSYFGLINPCGFKDKGVTSMEKELGYKVDVENLKDTLQSIFTNKLEAL